MNAPKQQPITEQLFTNPRKKLYDNIPTWLKVFIKTRLSRTPHHHLIIPATANHTSFSLGANPGAYSIRSLFKKEGNSQKKVHIISMIANFEKVIDVTKVTKDSSSTKYIPVDLNEFHWCDHGTLSLITTTNQSSASMRAFQETLYPEFKQQGSLFYCHCMAGRSRSFVETIVFLYLYPDKKQLFDFTDPGWDEIKKKIPSDLQERLRNTPSFSDIAEFVAMLRPQVKKLTALDGDQAGLLGILTLDKKADGNGAEISNLLIEKEFLYKEAQHIGLMLKSPLDSSFRDAEDRKAQEKNLVAVYEAYKKRGINLLMAMVVPLSMPVSKELSAEEFIPYFNKLKPSEQARFAILLHKLEEQNPELALGPLRGKSTNCAEIAAKKAKTLTAGDQVELLKTFGKTMAKIDYHSALKKIFAGTGIDRHNPGRQLAELLIAAKNNRADAKTILALEQAYSKLNHQERFNLVNKLFDLQYPEAKRLAMVMLSKYENRLLASFSDPLQESAKKLKEKLAEKTPEAQEALQKFQKELDKKKSELSAEELGPELFQQPKSLSQEDTPLAQTITKLPPARKSLSWLQHNPPAPTPQVQPPENTPTPSP